MSEMQIIVIFGIISAVNAYYDPHFVKGHTGIVHLFEWKWNDIADECAQFLGPRGFGGVQISPPSENLALSSSNRPWWERYQVMSYKLITRSGTEEEFANMVSICNKAGVRIYADVVFNHMTNALWSEKVGTGGSTANYSTLSYPGVPYTADDFHQPWCSIAATDYSTDAKKVRLCEISGLKDLNQTKKYVREKIAHYLNTLVGYGVAGFRIDAAKHMDPKDLEVIYGKVRNLNTRYGFAKHSRPYIYQEVIDLGREVISSSDYIALGAVTEFRFSMEISNAFLGKNDLRWLVTWGPQWGLLPDDVALVFVCNHDNQRSHGAGYDVLSFQNPRPYKAAVAFMLAHPYGQPQIISSYYFNNTDAGPPMDGREDIISPEFDEGGHCTNGWVCEHRWRQMYQMIAFRNQVKNTTVTNWWDNEYNQIAFCRGNLGFIAFNIQSNNMSETLQTCLPAGTYCDVISGSKVGNKCTGKTVTVAADGTAVIKISYRDEDAVLAIHVGDQSSLKMTPPSPRRSTNVWEKIVDGIKNIIPI